MNDRTLGPIPVEFVKQFVDNWKSAGDRLKAAGTAPAANVNICYYNSHGASELLDAWRKANGLPTAS